MDRIVVRISLPEVPSDDMPALEKIKLYARSGYHLHHIGMDEDFERVWSEAFPEAEKGSKVRRNRMATQAEVENATRRVLKEEGGEVKCVWSNHLTTTKAKCGTSTSHVRAATTLQSPSLLT
jgi:hypothetical protein